MTSFSQRLLVWHENNGRKGLPWQSTKDPYNVWLSEIMLQQTQVATVIPYYERFLSRFPNVSELGSASIRQVLELWSGLGYYVRAHNLHRCAQTIVSRHESLFPQDPVELAALPGIGRSTANAIAAFCFGRKVPILDGNVKRLLCRFLGIEGFPGYHDIESRLWREATALLPDIDVAAYIQAQMDMGATVCTRSKPHCSACPIAGDCNAFATKRTTVLPTPRPKKSIPEREVTLLVVSAGQRILLEQRPATGIWGGLLSLPELEEGDDASAYCERRFRLQLDTVSPAPTFTHAFTHFRLHIRPLFCEAKHAPDRLDATHFWLEPSALAQAALPAPIRKLLKLRSVCDERSEGLS